MFTHELGHLFGLEDAYIHSTGGCNPNGYNNWPTTMNAQEGTDYGSYLYVWDGCDGYGVNHIDSYDTQRIFHNGLQTFTNVGSQAIGNDSWLLSWDDCAYAESLYRLYDYWLDGDDGWQLFKVEDRKTGVALGEQWQPATITSTRQRPNAGPSYTTTCVTIVAITFEQKEWKCSPPLWVD